MTHDASASRKRVGAARKTLSVFMAFLLIVQMLLVSDFSTMLAQGEETSSAVQLDDASTAALRVEAEDWSDSDALKLAADLTVSEAAPEGADLSAGTLPKMVPASLELSFDLSAPEDACLLAGDTFTLDPSALKWPLALEDGAKFDLYAPDSEGNSTEEKVAEGVVENGVVTVKLTAEELPEPVESAENAEDGTNATPAVESGETVASENEPNTDVADASSEDAGSVVVANAGGEMLMGGGSSNAHDAASAVEGSGTAEHVTQLAGVGTVDVQLRSDVIGEEASKLSLLLRAGGNGIEEQRAEIALPSRTELLEQWGVRMDEDSQDENQPADVPAATLPEADGETPDAQADAATTEVSYTTSNPIDRTVTTIWCERKRRPAKETDGAEG